MGADDALRDELEAVSGNPATDPAPHTPWQVAAALLSARDATTVLRRVVEATRVLMAADAVAILLQDSETAQFVPTVPSVAVGLDERWLQRQGLPGAQALATQAAGACTVLEVPDMAVRPDLEIPLLAHGRRPAAVCAVPVEAEGTVVAVLLASYAVAGPLHLDRAALRDLAALAGVALAAVVARTREEAVRKRLEALDTATRTMAGELVLDRVLQRIVEIAAHLVGARYAALGVVGSDGYLSDFITTGLTPEERARIEPLPRGHGLLGVLIRQGQPLRVPNIQRDPRRVGFPPNHPPMTSLLGVAIRVRDEVVGDLYLTDKIGAPDFSDDDQHIVELLAAHAGIAIENARLYQSEQEAHRALQRAISTLRESEGRLRRQAELIDLAHDAIIVRDPASAITHWNRGAAEMYGWTADEAVGQATDTLLQTEFPVSLAKIDALLASEGMWEGELAHTRRDGERIVVESRQVLVRESAGGATAVLEINRNITQRKRAEEALRFLAAAGTALGTSLAEEDVLAAATRLVVSFLADCSSIVLVTDGGNLHIRALTHADPAREELVREVHRCYPPRPGGPSGLPQVVRSGQALLVGQVTAEHLVELAEDETHLTLLRAIGITAYMVVPLVAQGEVLGAMELMTAESGRQYDATALTLAEDVARRVALALANARLYARVQELTLLRERDRIGRDLHDGIIQDLYAGTLLLENVAEDLPAEAAEAVRQVSDHFNAVIGDVRTYIHGLRARDLQGRLLPEALATLVQEASAWGGPAVTFALGGEPYRLSDALANTLLHITREALSNVARHARATQAQVRLEYEPAGVTLTIADDGVGFDPEEPRGSEHRGLDNLRARSAETGAALDIASRPGAGTTITLTLPASPL